MTRAHERIDALLRRSGYPPLEEIKRNITRAYSQSAEGGGQEEGAEVVDVEAFDFQLAQVESDLDLLVSAAASKSRADVGAVTSL